MRNLVVCCDGTWNTPDQTDDDVPAPTNVVRFHNCLADGPLTGEDAEEQLVYYHPGVGTEGGQLDRLLGGGLGVGIGRNIQSAYRWLGDHYEPDDRIYLVGFSRGAYTVRCLTGMMSHCGLLATGEMDDAEAWKAIEAAYEAYLNRKRHPGHVWWSEDWPFHVPDPDDDDGQSTSHIPVHFLGVWDTVGALGIPDDLGFANLLDRFDRYSFSDTRLSPNVVHARHAVAMDERRSNFAATLWSEQWTSEQDVKELWFPGSHGDVGGGWAETGLSDGALQWMIQEAKQANAVFIEGMVEQIRPNYRGVLHETNAGLLKHLNPVPRGVPLIHDKARFHESALKRHDTPPITQAPYWRTRTFGKVGQEFEVPIYARQPWNATGLYLEKGQIYAFTAEGTWLDKNIRCGPGGTRDGDFQWGEIAHIASSLWGRAEGLIERVTDNEEVDLRGTRRHEEYPWFCLVGAVANDVNPDVSGTPLRHETFQIGDSLARFSPQKSGYFYAYANDAWHFYSNNRGSVRLRITRLE